MQAGQPPKLQWHTISAANELVQSGSKLAQRAPGGSLARQHAGDAADTVDAAAALFDNAIIRLLLLQQRRRLHGCLGIATRVAGSRGICPPQRYQAARAGVSVVGAYVLQQICHTPCKSAQHAYSPAVMR